MEKKDLVNTSCMLVDLIEGDESVYPLLQGFDLKKINTALDYLLHNERLNDTQKLRLATNSWKIHYRDKPPSPEEFINPKYLGRVAEGTYDRVRNTFTSFLNPQNKYRHLVLYPHIGWGKSFLSSLVTLYIAVHLSLMRDPKRYFGLNPATVLGQVLVSYSLDKSSEILLEPLMNILEAAPFFERCRTKEDMIKKEDDFQRKKNVDVIYWTTAGRTSELAFSNGSQLKLCSTVHSLLGLTIVSGTLTELAFFRDAGKSDDYIMRIFNDLKGRIKSRMKGNYFGRSILDSSPNDLDSPIDRYCWSDAERDPYNMVIKGSYWKWNPIEFENIDEQFYVHLGGKGIEPQVLNTTIGYDPTEIITVPKETELFQVFKNDPKKALKDWAGIPTGNNDKLFSSIHTIENIFTDNLKNIYTHITAHEKLPPQGLIWNKIVDEFFYTLNGKYTFYYKPYLPRVFHIDQAVSGDYASIAVCHCEHKLNELKEYQPMFIIDFTIVISPSGGRINLDAIKFFIEDLIKKGHMSLVHGSFDQFQSEATIQYLQRDLGLDIEQLSVDREMGSYLSFAQYVEQGQIKVGKNIHLKNNMRSLRLVARKRSHTLKIDHTSGDLPDPNGNAEWGTSLIGLHSKDCADAVCGSVELAKRYLATGLHLKETWNEDEIVLTMEQKKDKTNNWLQNMGYITVQ